MAALSKTYNSTGRSSQAPAGVDQSQWSANPYAQFDYRHTWWQKLWEGLGFRSKFDEYRDSMALNAAEYDSQLAEKAHNEEYDSPVEQNARLRAAGINPDLAGETSSGAASPMQPDPNAPISPGFDDPVSIVRGFGDTVMTCLNGAIGFAKAGLDLTAMRNDVDAGKLSNSKGLFNYAMELARRYVPAEMPSEDNAGWQDRSISLAAENAGIHLSRSQQKALKQHLGAIYTSAPGKAEQWSSWIDMMDNTIQGNIRRQSEFWKDGTDEVIMDAVKPLVHFFDRITKLRPQAEASGLASETSQNQYTEDLYDNLDPSLSANVQNATNQRNLNSAKIDTYLNDAMEEIIHNLKDRSESNKSGHGLATAALLFFQVMRMMNWSPSFNSSQTTGPKGTTSSFGFGF